MTIESELKRIGDLLEYLVKNQGMLGLAPIKEPEPEKEDKPPKKRGPKKTKPKEISLNELRAILIDAGKIEGGKVLKDFGFAKLGDIPKTQYREIFDAVLAKPDTDEPATDE